MTKLYQSNGATVWVPKGWTRWTLLGVDYRRIGDRIERCEGVVWWPVELQVVLPIPAEVLPFARPA